MCTYLQYLSKCTVISSCPHTFDRILLHRRVNQQPSDGSRDQRTADRAAVEPITYHLNSRVRVRLHFHFTDSLKAHVLSLCLWQNSTNLNPDGGSLSTGFMLAVSISYLFSLPLLSGELNAPLCSVAAALFIQFIKHDHNKHKDRRFQVVTARSFRSSKGKHKLSR